ncbi:MAG: DUF202 domain-containing protein [Gemmataceae bacterium]
MSVGESDNGRNDARVWLAAERTLLAWIRTGLAMMGFGFVVARFGWFLRELTAADPSRPLPPSGLSMVFGTSLVVLGVIVNLSACALHMKFRRSLSQGEPYRPARWPLEVLVGMVLAVIGVAVVVFLLVPRS